MFELKPKHYILSLLLILTLLIIVGYAFDPRCPKGKTIITTYPPGWDKVGVYSECR